MTDKEKREQFLRSIANQPSVVRAKATLIDAAQAQSLENTAKQERVVLHDAAIAKLVKDKLGGVDLRKTDFDRVYLLEWSFNPNPGSAHRIPSCPSLNIPLWLEEENEYIVGMQQTMVIFLRYVRGQPSIPPCEISFMEQKDATYTMFQTNKKGYYKALLYVCDPAYRTAPVESISRN